MADESLQLPPQNLDFQIISLLQKLDSMRKETHVHRIDSRLSKSMKAKHIMQVEIRSLKFWRAILAECLASFLYVFIVCGAAAGTGVGASISSVLLATALSSAFVVTTLTQCLSHISGAHINPAVTFGMLVSGAISLFRAVMYATAQCGGAIGAAALLYSIYSVTVDGYKGNLDAVILHSANLGAGQRLGIETLLTFIVVLVYLMSTDSYKSYFGVSSLTIGAAYGACSFVSMPYLNPARSLGPSFVLSKWDNHWVYWAGSLIGAAIAGVAYRFVFRPQPAFKLSHDMDNDSASISDDDTNFELDSDKQPKFHGSAYRAANGAFQSHNGQNFYTMEFGGAKNDQMEPIYGGTRSMYCKSPALTRANLNRSQSVYAKSNTALNREVLPRAGPLVPAQSLYPLRMTTHGQNSHLQNQNVQNQMQQRSESIYGIRSSMRHERPMQQAQPQQSNDTSANSIPPNFQSVYGTRTNPNQDQYKLERETPSRDDGKMFGNRQCRPDSMYGSSQRRAQAAQSDDSSYGSSYPESIPQTSSTPLSQPPLPSTYGPTMSTSQPMRPPNGQMNRKPSMNGGMELKSFSQNQMQMQSRPMMGGVNSTNGPITHQYNMQQIRS